MGGSIATAGGLVFIGATTDSKFRAFDSRTGKELWVTRLDATADAVPMTYLGRDGKQYVVIAAGGTNRFRMLAGTADEVSDSLIAFSLGDAATPAPPPTVAAQPARPSAVAPGAGSETLPDGPGKAVVVRICTACHGTSIFTQVRMGRTGWKDEVQAMVERGARGTSAEIRTVIDYLTKHYSK
jgi:quinoprotein glucose dehydrogenase